MITHNSQRITQNSPKVSVIIPVVRPEKGARCAEAARSCAGIPEENIEILLVEDTEHIGAPAMVAKLTAMASHDLICFLGDDTIPQADFLKNALSAMEMLPDAWGLVCLNDGIWNGTNATHWLAHKRLLDHLPDRQFFSTAYGHAFCDRELTDICQEMGRYIYAEAAVILHDHPHVTGETPDEHYAKIYEKEYFMRDQRTYWRRKRTRKGFNLGIGLPLAGTYRDDQFWISFIALEKPDYSLFVPRIQIGEFSWDVSVIRDDIIEQALEAGVSHLWMADTDQTYPAGTLMRLLEHAASGKDVVAAPVHRRYPPYQVTAVRGEPDKYTLLPDEELYSNRLVEIDGTGGCILFNMDVFTDLDRPWFALQKTLTGQPFGEDYYLCWRLRQAGIPLYLDTAIEVGHIGRIVINRTLYEITKKLMKSQQRRKDNGRNSD